MKTIHHLITLAVALATAQLAPAAVPSAVPSAINYQGRLTNAAGVPQPGNRTMSVKVYDAATGGTQLYSESLGSVAVDANGVYSFQFGATGTSSTLVSETLATTDGVGSTYSKALSNTPVVAGTASVTDGTYSWNELTGNPGSRATATATTISGFVVGGTVTSGGSGYSSAPAVIITGNGTGAAATATISSGAVSAINITSAGSGYTTGATITIASPPAPFVINYTGGTITATYATVPAAGQAITATYRYSASGISGALAAGSEQWLELTVDGVTQSPMQQVLAVPFAVTAGTAMQLVQRIGLTSSLISFSNLNSSGSLSFANTGKAVYQLPLQLTSTQGTYSHGDTISCKLQRFLDTQNMSKISSLSVDIESNSSSITRPVGDSGPQTFTSQSYVKLALVSYSVAGNRVTLAEQTITASNGTILLSGPFQISGQDNEYAVELEVGYTGQDASGTNAVPGTHFRAGAVKMNYNSK